MHVGGKTDQRERFIEPTVLSDVHPESKIMQKEIFGPLLPVIEYDHIESIEKEISQRPKPLALYLFTRDRKLENQLVALHP